MNLQEDDIVCNCCKVDDPECNCYDCHPCYTCSGCLNCNCNCRDRDRDEKCLCDSPSDCECLICIKTEKCPNYLFCKNKMHQELLDCHDGRCMECDCYLGKSYNFISETDECVICYNQKHVFVKMPSCCHKICTDCFKNFTDSDNNINPNVCTLCRKDSSPRWAN